MPKIKIKINIHKYVCNKRNSEGVHPLHLYTQTATGHLTWVKWSITLLNGLWRGAEKFFFVHTPTPIVQIRVKYHLGVGNDVYTVLNCVSWV